MPKVLIKVSGGVAYVMATEIDITVVIADYDNPSVDFINAPKSENFKTMYKETLCEVGL